MDRIEIIYNAIDQMGVAHGTSRPPKFGGGIWDFDEEIALWKKDVIEKEKIFGRDPLTLLQWETIDLYIAEKRKNLYGDKMI